MTSKPIKLQIISVTGVQLETIADSVNLPATDGSIGIYPNHTPALIALKDGMVTYMADREENSYEIHSGFAEIRDNVVSVII